MRSGGFRDRWARKKKMGKYTGSPWGFVRGKIGDAVGSIWKTIEYVRVRVDPTQRGTYANYLLYKAGQIPILQFSYPQFNLRRLAIGPLGYVSRNNLANWIDPIWTKLANDMNEALTGCNLFIKEALPAFFASMPDKTIEYDPVTNAPLLNSLLVSDGDLEPVPSILSAVYTTGTGVLAITWDTDTFGNGSATDEVGWLVMRLPLVNGLFQPTLYSYGTFVGALDFVRSAGTGNISLPIGLTASDLVVYLVCRDTPMSIGYSPSKSRPVLPA